MYEVTGDDRVVELDGYPIPNADTPDPILLSRGSRFALMYISSIEPDGTASYAVLGGIGSHYFGVPNDEALHGHPLYERGLRWYRVQEVLDSSWIAASERRNRVHPKHNPSNFSKRRHFLISFHDELFECMSEQLNVVIITQNLIDARTALTDWIGWSDYPSFEPI